MYGPILLLLAIFWMGVLGEGPQREAYPID